MKNSNETIDMIAKNCGFSKQKVLRMMKHLEKEQKIWGYAPVIDNTKQHLEKFILFIRRTTTQHNPKDINEIVANLLATTKQEIGVTMVSSYLLHGEYDWIMLFTAKSIIQAKKFSETIMQKYPDKQSIQISQVIFTVRENYMVNPEIIKMKDLI